MKRLTSILAIVLFFVSTAPAFAISTSPEITSYTGSTIEIITTIASIAVVFFIIKGGISYITSTGSPERLENAKKTIRNALIGLVIILASGFIVSVLSGAMNAPSGIGSGNPVSITPINTVTPSDGLTQVLIDAVSSFIQNIVQSATQPIVNGVLGFLTTTPSLLNNSVISNFWLVSLGITDSLFVIAVALLGLQLMSATTLGFEEVELKILLPRIGIAFLGANISLFLADYVITTANAMTTTVINATGGLNQAWILNAVNPASFITENTPIITLIFLVLFLIVAVVLLLMYISRLILISLAGALSPFIFLLWSIPKFADTAEMAVKSYFVTVFTIFVNVVIIQLASSFLIVSGNSNNSLVSILIAIGLFMTLLKTPSFMMNLVLSASKNQTLKNMGRQVVNVVSANATSAITRVKDAERGLTKISRKEIDA